jgi:galactose oxidase
MLSNRLCFPQQYLIIFCVLLHSDNHMWLFTAPNGKIFHAGPSKITHYISLDGDGAIKEKLCRGSDHTMNGNAVMFDIGKILTLGGSPDYEFLNATAEAHVITLDPYGSDDVSVERVQDLLYPRAMANSVVLPNGNVVVVGGMVRARTFSVEGSVLMAEMFDPVTKAFTPLASMSVERNYHSSAILLKDGRVFAGGGGQCARLCADNINKFNCEVFTPPYLVDPVSNSLITNRPVIVSAPTQAAPGDVIEVTTQSTVASFALVRLGAATHSTNLDSRRIPLVPSSTVGTTYTLTLPRAAICLPGTYFLFVMDNAGVPSVGETISIRKPIQ